MAGKYGPSSVTMTLEDGPGGTARALTAFITGGLTVNMSSEMAETTALGDSAKAYTPVGITSGENLSITGIWSTASNASHAVLNAVDDGPQDDTRQAVIVFGDSKTATIQTRLISYSVIASNDNIQTFSAELQVTGAVVWS